jgi:hypothetical protein
MILRFSTILLLPTLTHSSNTVSITHRSIGTRDYTQGLNVVKTDINQDDQEYVTSFYKRVQHKVKDRDGLFTKEYEEEDVKRMESTPSPPQHRKPFSFLQKTVSQDAAGVRGGAASSLKMQSLPSNRYSYGDRGNHNRSKKKTFIKKTNTAPSFQQHRSEPVQEIVEKDDALYFSEYDEYEENNDYYTSTEEGQDDYPPGEHHLGLLRVPCSIAINSGEDGRLDHYAEVSRGRGVSFDDHHHGMFCLMNLYVCLS